MRIASLNNLVAYGFLNLHDGSFDLLNRPHGRLSHERYVSETIHDQVRVRVAEGLEPAEHLMAIELDRLLKIVSAGNHARIIAGICLLRLVLIYRDRLVRDEIRISLPNNTTRKLISTSLGIYVLIKSGWQVTSIAWKRLRPSTDD